MMKQILVVDDDQLMHRLFQHHLERAGYQMVSALNGREALDIVARQPPALIVMDIMMPDVDGLVALRELKNRMPPSPFPSSSLRPMATNWRARNRRPVVRRFF